MGFRCLFIALACAFSAPQLWGNESFPFRARVAQPEAEVRCGPGAENYVTERLPQGTEVEVHRRDAGGWLAIRPPDTSFSWIPSNKLWKTNDPTIATVVANDAVSWVGSRVVAVKEHRWQVRLQKGETVAIMAEEKFPNAESGGSELWCRISPPAGEFRWIRDRDVTQALAAPGLVIDRPPSSSGASEVKSRDEQVVRASFVESVSSANGSVRQTAEQAAIPNAAGFRAPRVRETVARANPPSETRQLEQHLAATLSSDSPPASDEILELETQLSLMVAKEPVVWNLDTIHDRTEALVSNGKTPVDRGRARLLLEKVEHFEELQRRFIQVERRVAIAKGEASAAASLQPRFDGSGWLYPVHSSKKVAPPFALMDEKGRIISYVAPAPGLNLHRYEKKKVGIYGQRGNSASLNAPVLTAHQVVDLDRHAVR